MFKIIALICLSGQDPQDCQPPTAQDVMVLGEQQDELSCMRQAQMSAGKIAIFQNLDSHEWVKFVCERQ